jgi:alkylated DNA repair protein (DNA oxidative demethylase)
MVDLFPRTPVEIDAGAVLLPGYAAPTDDLLRQIVAIADRSTFRFQTIPGGRRMSVAMTSTGASGWTSDLRGYRYSPVDPDSGAPWPPMPPAFAALAASAAAEAGYPGFAPDTCLINRYATGARMGLHQDRDEQDLSQPIVSVSIGVPATFLWAGATRAGGSRRYRLLDGDVVVWGGPSRLAFHGVAPLAAGHHPATGAFRYNLTFRRAEGG